MKSLQTRIYEVLEGSVENKAARACEIFIASVVVLNVIAIILESVHELHEAYETYFHIFDVASVMIFTLEYMLRVWSYGVKYKKEEGGGWRGRKEYIFSFYGMVDLISFIPNYLTFFFAGLQYLMVIRALRLLRIFRILKLSRFLDQGNILKNALKASVHKIVVFIATVITVVTIVGTLMYIIEGDESGFTSIPISIYWAIVTITTVGYGDISPQSPLGQFLASFLMIIGYGIIAVPTGIVTIEMARANDEARVKCPDCNFPIYPKNANFCANCGKELIRRTPTIGE